VLSPVQESISQAMSPDMATYAIDDQQIQDYRRALSPVQKELIADKDYQEFISDNLYKSAEIMEDLVWNLIKIL